MYVCLEDRQSDLKQMLDNGYTLHISCLVGGMGPQGEIHYNVRFYPVQPWLVAMQ